MALLIAVRLARPLVRDERVHAFALAVLVGGLITARLGHVVDNWPAYAAAPEQIAAFWNGGIAVTAAPIGSTLAGLVAARRLRLPAAFMLDVAAIAIVAGLAVGRVGDMINGEHHAVACAGLPWCVGYTAPDTLGQRGPVHPVAAYDGIVALVIAAVGHAYRRRTLFRPPDGRTYLLVLGLYGAARFATSFLRLDPVVAWGLQEAQILGLLYAVIAFPLLALLTLRSRSAQVFGVRS